MIGLYFLIAALGFLAPCFAVKKLTLNIDEDKLLEPIKADICPRFCDIIDEEIRALKEDVENGEFELLEDEKKEESLESLGDLSRKLTFIQMMNLSRESDPTWQSELFDFLKELENSILRYLKDAKILSDTLREKLVDAFESLKA